MVSLSLGSSHGSRAASHDVPGPWFQTVGLLWASLRSPGYFESSRWVLVGPAGVPLSILGVAIGVGFGSLGVPKGFVWAPLRLFAVP